MQLIKRVSFFLIVNALVLVTISITSILIFAALGIHAPQGTQALLLLCGLMGFGGAFISLLISKWMAKRSFGVQVIPSGTADSEAQWLVSTVHALARKAKLEVMPEVGIYNSPEINAFATGPSKKDSLVAVSTGLLRGMSKEEVEGVLGHEIAHIANGDMVTMTLIQGVVNTFVLFLSRLLASAIANSGNSDERRGGFMVQWMLTMLFDVVFTILASVLVNYFSRRREFRADSGGAEFAGREKMIAGLRRLQSQYEQIPADNSGNATLKISAKSSGIWALFSTHPPLSARIRALQAQTL
jgi:heat shock protein HtpX